MTDQKVRPLMYKDAPIGLCHFDTGLRYRHVNDWLAALSGIPPDEHLGRTIGEIQPNVAAGVELKLRHVLETGEPVVRGLVQAEVPAEPGVTRTFEHNYYAVRSADGTIVGVSCVVQDVTERVRAEAERVRYESMITASSDLMVFVDHTYTYRAVNQAYCDEHQRTKEEIVGHTVAELFGEEAFQMTLRPPMDRCLSGERVTFDFWWHSPRRGRRHVDARYDPFFEADGSVSGVLVDARDTTDRKRIEEQLERSIAALQAANRELEVFSDSLAHDLKNPLLTVTQFSVYLADALAESLNDEQQDYLTRIRAAGRHMTHIIDDLRDLADVRRLDISLEEVDMSALALGIIDELRALIPGREVQFDAEPEITAVGDKTLLRLLLTNLLQNSWKYTGPSDRPCIALGIDRDENDVPTYYVRDNGIGFDDADRERIFGVFERLHSTVEFAGSGLGLATVEKIVHRHGGRVWAEGHSGEGAIFRFTLARPTTDENDHE